MTTLKWRRSDECYVESHCETYGIEPNWNHSSTRPQSYTVYFYPKLREDSLPRERVGGGYTIADAKHIAERHHAKQGVNP